MIIAADSIPVTTSIVGVVTALATLVTAFSVLVGALPALLKLRREVLAQRADVNHARSEVQEVHKIVNQQRTDMVRYERALVAALKRAGVEVPVDQSIDPGSQDETKPQER